MKITKISVLAMIGTLLLGSISIAGSSKTVRATDLTAKVWSDFNQGTIQDLMIEFRQGDRLPVTFQAQGDFIETTESSPSYITVRRPFWIKATQREILLSLDGSNFKDFKQMVTGSFTAGATADQNSGGPANAINMLFKAYLKQ